jgi:hypothetical protein
MWRSQHPGASARHPGLTEIQGCVRMALHGPRGDVNGALLEDGTVLRLPPPEAARFASLLQPGQTVAAKGDELTNPLAEVLEAHQLGASRTQLSLVARPRGPERRRPRRLPMPTRRLPLLRRVPEERCRRCAAAPLLTR